MSTNIRRALYGRLSGDTTLNNLLGATAAGYSKSIYHNQAPANAGFPFVIFFKSSGMPTETMGTPTAYESDVWTVKAVDQGTSADVAESISARVLTLLNDASLSISGATLMYLRRSSDLEYVELVDGVTYQHVGAQYRLLWE